MWVFGYGSLVWKADFPYTCRVVGYIKGYMRRFWQNSEDHRGIPGKPGRVVTLLPSLDTEAQVWGIAYEIATEHEESVTKHLDFREKEGYKKVVVQFYPSGKAAEPGGCLTLSGPFDLVIYVGTESNEWFAGEADIPTIAKQIVSSVGPSGRNTEYLYKLAAAMRNLAPSISDEHLFTLEAAVHSLESNCK